MELLEPAWQCLRAVPAINSGGCGISALAMARYLRKQGYQGDLSFTFVGNGYEENSEALVHGEPGVAPSHVLLSLDGDLYDSDGEYRGRYGWECLDVNEEFLVSTINTDTWNSCFDRDETLHIQEELDVDLSDVELGL